MLGDGLTIASAPRIAYAKASSAATSQPSRAKASANSRSSGACTESRSPLDGGPGKPLKKPAITAFARLATAELPIPSSDFPSSRYALLRCEPHTGRFRQIRRHLKHIHHHLIGDSSHGDGRHNRVFRAMGISRMLLHAERLAFVHPSGGGRVQVQAPLDGEFSRAFARLGWETGPR